MKIKYFMTVLLAMMLVCSALNAGKYDKIKSAENTSVPFYLENSNLGTDFWVAIPDNSPNTTWGWGGTIGIEIVVTPIAKTDITIENPSFGFMKTVSDIEPYQTVIFNEDNGGLISGWVCTESEKISGKGIHIYSDEPIAVFVSNAKRYSSEGYMAIPTSAWGKEYYNCSYYDHYREDWWGNGIQNASGFIIVAGYNSTNVKIELKGKGKGYATTVQGNEIGEKINVNLGRGETYYVEGNAEVSAVFDLTGTQITSSKPVGVISCHLKTTVPSSIPVQYYYYDWWGDNLMEMLASTDKWGKTFVSCELTREASGNRSGKGDMFRAVTSEPNNSLECKYYDRNSGSIIGQSPSVLNQPGKFSEHRDITQIDPDTNSQKSIYGLSFWESEKPIQLMQYAYSSQWDGDENWDAMQMMVPPIEQFVSNTVFMAPSSELEFGTNELTLFAVADPADKNFETLKSVKLDGKSVVSLDGTIMANKIPGTNIHWIKRFVSPGAHVITSDTKICGYVTGNKRHCAYGWPITSGMDVLTTEDNNHPQYEVSGECGEYTVDVTENEADDTGLSRIFLINENSYNYTLEIDDPDRFIPANHIKWVKFYLKLKDELSEGKAMFAILDRAGNYVVDSVMYYPDKINIEQELIDFGLTRVGTEKVMKVNIENDGEEELEILSLSLYYGDKFRFIDNELTNGFSIDAGSSREIEVGYTPNKEMIEYFNYDTLLIHSKCIKYSIMLRGKGIIPHIEVQDYNFGDLEVYEQKCLEEINGKGLKISNPGTDTLNVVNITDIEPPFIITNPTPQFPFKIPPGKDTAFKSVCFFPEDSGSYNQTIAVISDAEEGNVTLELSGHAFEEEDTTNVNYYTANENPELLSIEPNPIFGDMININYKIDKYSDAGIEIYNDIGIRIKSIVINDRNPGRYNIKVSIAELSAGMYYVRLSYGEVNVTGKFVVLK